MAAALRLLLLATLSVVALARSVSDVGVGRVSRFKPTLADELRTVGTPAVIEYSVMEETGKIPTRPCDDLRQKIWVAVHLHADYGTSNRARLTVVRLDNAAVKREGPPKGQKCLCDKLWHDIAGWSEPLTIRVCGLRTAVPTPRTGWTCTTIKIPKTDDRGDVYTSDIVVRGLTPASEMAIDIPRRVIRVTHDSATKKALVLDKIGVLISVLNPNYVQYEVYADEMLEAARGLPDGERVVEAINAVQPIAYKVDIFRVAELLANGGVYCDSKILPTRPFDSFLPVSGGFFPYDIGYHGIWNGFMAFPPNDRLMQRALDLIYANVQMRYYGSTTLAPTGPQLVLRAYQDVRELESHDVYLHDAILDRDGVLIVEDRDAVSAKSEKYDPHTLMVVHNAEYRRNFTDSNLCHYTKLWDARAVYYEAPCDPVLGLPWNTRLGAWNAHVRIVVFVAASMCLVTLLGLTLYILLVRRRDRAKAQESEVEPSTEANESA